MKTAAASVSFRPLLAVLLIAAGALPAAASQKDEQAIREVLDGTRKVAQAAWWGFDADNSTAALQAAIDSGAEKVVVEKMSGPWIVGPIRLVSHQELLFEPGVVVLAKRGAFRGKSDSLLSAWGATDLKLTGQQATLQMHRADYDGPDYAKAEWRHVLNFHGCTNVTVAGLTLAESGGDGIYLGAGRDGAPNRNVVIRDVVCDRNYRQGISVITAENLSIENCILRNTAGTAPAAGIDFEPNRPTELLVNCVMRRCTIETNQGYALHVYAGHMDATSKPISLRVEDCTTRGTNARSVSIVTRCGEKGPVTGTIEMLRCRFEDRGATGIRIASKPPEGLRVRLVECVLADPAEKSTVAAPILFSSRRGDQAATGGLELVDCTIRDQTARPPIALDDGTGNRLRGVTGTLTVETGGKHTAYTVDQALIDRWVPYDPIVEIPRVRLEGLSLQPVGAGAAPPDDKLPGHRLRGDALYLLHAAKGDRVSLRLKHQPVGRYEGRPLAVQVLDPAGRQVAQATIPLKEEAPCNFQAPVTGTYRIEAKPDRHTLAATRSSHPIVIAADEGVFHLLGTTGDFYFHVPAGTRQFGLRVRGEGEAERVSAALFDAAGHLVWQQENIGPAVSHRHQQQPSQQGVIWRLHLARPTVGVLEDCTVELRGLPPLLGFRPETVPSPAVGRGAL